MLFLQCTANLHRLLTGKDKFFIFIEFLDFDPPSLRILRTVMLDIAG